MVINKKKRFGSRLDKCLLKSSNGSVCDFILFYIKNNSSIYLTGIFKGTREKLLQLNDLKENDKCPSRSSVRSVVATPANHEVKQKEKKMISYLTPETIVCGRINSI